MLLLVWFEINPPLSETHLIKPRYLPKPACQRFTVTANSALLKPSLKVFAKTKVNIMFPGSSSGPEMIEFSRSEAFLGT